MRFLCGALALMYLPSFALASDGNECDQLWFARNSMLNRVGYCFQSPLGQAIFDNSDCTTRDPRPRRVAQVMIKRIQDQEAKLQCDVDVARTALDDHFSYFVDQLIGVDVLPSSPRDEFDGGTCIGYLGDTIHVRTSPEHSAEVVGLITKGMNFNNAHDTGLYDGTLEVWPGSKYANAEYEDLPDDHVWEFISYSRDNGHYKSGWIYVPAKQFMYNNCDGFAG